MYSSSSINYYSRRRDHGCLGCPGPRLLRLPLHAGRILVIQSLKMALNIISMVIM